MADNVLGAGATFTVDMSAVSSSGALNFDAAAELDGNYIVTGTQGDDTIVGGAGKDRLGGVGGQDVLTGNGANDTFFFNNVSESTSSTYDSIHDFHVRGDKIALDVVVTGVDAAVLAGTLDAGSMDADLSAAIGAGQLLAGHAMLFRPDSGGLSGHTFLVVDANGQAGYQASADYVIDVTGGTRLGEFSTIDFTHS
jgi:Ca2+-binding RTX toxin-like protein